MKKQTSKLIAIGKEILAQTEADALAADIEAAIKKSFPKSYVTSRFDNRLGSSIGIRFALGKDKSEWSNGIIHNDPLHTIMMVGFDQMTPEGKLGDKLTAEMSVGGSMWTGDERIKIGFRKKTGAPKQIAPYIGKYFEKAKKVYLENKDKLSDLVKNKY